MRHTGNAVIITDLDAPRNQFNSGYHDARFDVGRGTPRQLVPFGKPSEHDVQHVSQGFSPYYFHGYRIGLASAPENTSSAGAWLRWLETLTAADRAGVETHQLLCEIGGRPPSHHRSPRRLIRKAGPTAGRLEETHAANAARDLEAMLSPLPLRPPLP